MLEKLNKKIITGRFKFVDLNAKLGVKEKLKYR